MSSDEATFLEKVRDQRVTVQDYATFVNLELDKALTLFMGGKYTEAEELRRNASNYTQFEDSRLH